MAMFGTLFESLPIIGPMLASNRYGSRARKLAENNQATVDQYRPGLLEALNQQVNDPYTAANQAQFQTTTSATQRDLANATRNLAQNYGNMGLGQSATAAAALASANRQAMDANRTAQTQRIAMSDQQKNQAIQMLLAALGNPQQLQDTYSQLSQQYGQQATADLQGLLGIMSGGLFAGKGGEAVNAGSNGITSGGNYNTLLPPVDWNTRPIPSAPYPKLFP